MWWYSMVDAYTSCMPHSLKHICRSDNIPQANGLSSWGCGSPWGVAWGSPLMSFKTWFFYLRCVLVLSSFPLYFWSYSTDILCLYWQILVPVPQYPLYSAAISLFGGSLVPYYLEETANWGLDINNLRQSVAQARFKGITVSAPFQASHAYLCQCKGKKREWVHHGSQNLSNYIGTC